LLPAHIAANTDRKEISVAFDPGDPIRKMGDIIFSTEFIFKD
jgi:hypothetical protein